MRAQIKKELLEAAYPIAVLFFGLCWAWIGVLRFEDVLIEPIIQRCWLVVGTAVVAGAVIGYVQFAAERWRGTFGFAVHRRGGFASLLAAKMLVGVPATLLLAIGPPLAFALWHAIFSLNAAVIQTERLVEYAIYGASGVSGYALGLLLAQLRRAWWCELSVLVLGAVGLVGMTLLTLYFAGSSLIPAVFVYLLVQLGVAAALSMLALKLMQGARDRNLPLPSGQLVALSAFALAIVLPAMTLGGLLEEFVRYKIIHDYPVIAQSTENGALHVIDRLSPELVDAREEDGREPKARLVYWPLIGSSRLSESPRLELPVRHGVRESALLPYWQPLWDWRTPPAFERQGPRFWALGFLDSAEGTIVITWMELKDRERPAGVRVEHETRSSPWSRAFQKPGGRGRFSASTVRMSLLSLHAGPLESREWCVVDLEDHSLWRISPMSISEVLSELHLPGDDRLVRVEPFYMRDPLRVGSYVGYGDALLFVGEKDKYVWRADGFETYAGNVRPEIIHGRLIDEPVPASEAAEMLSLRVRQTDSDPVRPRVEVLDPSGARVLLAHEYAPETIPAKLETALMFALSLLRMPIACAYSFLPWSDEGVDRLYAVGGAHAFDEPLILHGKRPWLLALNLMVAGLCAISLVKRMKRQGTNDAAILCCASTVILCGVIAYVYFRGLMPKRSSIAPATTQRSEARELLIQSA